VAKRIFLALLLMANGAGVYAQASRNVNGTIYFTNNTPDDVSSFPVEVLARNRRKIVATTRPDEHHRFNFAGVAPGKYLLKLTWPRRCVLWYRLDLSKQSQTEIPIIMDAACAHFNGKIRDLPVK
jgi:hypothetical protein